MMRIIKYALVLLLLLAVAAAGAAAWAWKQYGERPLVMRQSTVQVQIPKGAAPRQIAVELRKQGIDVEPWWLAAATRLRGDAGQLKSGLYQVQAPVSLRELLDLLVSGNVLLREIRFIEGWTFRQLREELNRNPDLLHDSKALSDREILKRLEATEPHPEGLFFPSTYRFTPGSSDLDVLRQAYRQMRRSLDQAWQARTPDLPYRSPYDMLIMASIIEKETGQEADRVKVAAVFVNRLRVRMLLQSDPTTIYGMGDRFDGNLRRRDLQTDTEYNTYTRPGLPPTPIALPGNNSLMAAASPADSPALYFVARGDGSSEFSNDLSAHNRAVARFQLRGRQGGQQP